MLIGAHDSSAGGVGGGHESAETDTLGRRVTMAAGRLVVVVGCEDERADHLLFGRS